MQVLAVKPNFQGRRDNVDAAINLDNESLKQLALNKTNLDVNPKRNRKITNTLFYAAPLAAGLATAALCPNKVEYIFEDGKKIIKNIKPSYKVFAGLKTAGIWTAALGAVDLLGFGHKKLAQHSSDVRKFNNEHPILSSLMMIGAGLAAIYGVSKGANKLLTLKRPDFINKAIDKTAQYINKGEMAVKFRSQLAKISEVTPSALKDIGKNILEWSPTMLLFGGLFHSISSKNRENQAFMKNYMELKNQQSDLAKARVRELSMQNDFLIQDPKNKEDIDLLNDPFAGLAEEIAHAEQINADDAADVIPEEVEEE